MFICVRAFWNPRKYCSDPYYRDYCHQSCKRCMSDKKVSCVNFKDDVYYGCAYRAEQGFCTHEIRNERYYMKTNCPKTCCMLGRLYW